jgi:hypothetical protein
VLKANKFFILCQKKWIDRVVKEDNMEPPSAEDISNINNGGVCSAFEIIDELKDAFVHDR